ncbi:MAG TPA: DUF349 domain-containing protein [Candidatus Cryptobacteroides merdipullorum]|uniref:DUF349 domain-containing protein n=1 Tax=Candidatus Cryptobacteroides merdipullorum TaxID=2840771 RepID=A0A9D1GMP4_9BACT|nr:DUF349 domain-containing protein [Candidatus Cryptobacteroides merdipullorum]
MQEVLADAAEKVNDVVEAAGDKLETLAGKVDDAVETVKDKLDELGDKTEETVGNAADKAEELADKSLAELSDMFVKLKDSADSMLRSKEAEAIKSAFYKLLTKLKGENPEMSDDSRNNPFEAVEQNFKALYADYKKERAEYNRQQEEQREANLAKKQAIIEDLKTLVEGQDDMSSQFPAFREIQNRWREAGPVPAQAFRDINDRYQFYVEKFYDMVKISRDLRDLDFKKNLEVKEALCEAAEKLAENENIVEAFHELQKLHEQWKEYGPVAKEKREEIWDRFKAATAVINKRYQAHFEELKGQQVENLEKKRRLCERVEEIAAREVKGSAEWNAFSKEIEEIQAEWRKIGFATKKENQKIYDRFRAACDAFFGRKREYYSGIKGAMNENLEKKEALIEQAEALKDSTEWKKTTDQYISLQKQWKEIGPVPRKKSEQLWKRFRAACDEFFARRDANASPENDFYGNLKAKRKLIEEIRAYVPGDDETANAEMMREFNERWQAIGHVPFKEKDNILAGFREAMQEKFPLFSHQRTGRQGSSQKRSPKDILIAKYNALQQNITTYENNIGFFSASSSDSPLIKQMRAKIDEAKAELKKLEEQIRNAEEENK